MYADKNQTPRILIPINYNDGRRYLNQINDMCVKNKSAAAVA